MRHLAGAETVETPQADADFAALCARLPVLRRHEHLVGTRLHQWALRFPGTRGDTLNGVVTYLRDNVTTVSPINRAFMRRMVLFADLVMDGTPPEKAADNACREHPDPLTTVTRRPPRPVAAPAGARSARATPRRPDPGRRRRG